MYRLDNIEGTDIMQAACNNKNSMQYSHYQLCSFAALVLFQMPVI